MHESLQPNHTLPTYEVWQSPEPLVGVSTAVALELAPFVEEVPQSRRERFGRSRTARVIASTAAFGAFAAGATLEATPAHADPAQVYEVNPNTAAGGVYSRDSPHTNDTNRKPGAGVYPGDIVELDCGVTDGDAVGPYANRTWHFLENKTRPQLGKFWVADRYLLTPIPANVLAPGERECGGDVAPTDNSRSAETLPVFVDYNRQQSADWALSHAKNTPPNAGSCTWFVSNSLWVAGIDQTADWNSERRSLPDNITQYGTDIAWRTADFLDYMRSQPYATVTDIGRIDGKANLPDARLGDVIIYNWEGDRAPEPDHAVVITGFSTKNPQYPLVSGWSEDNGNALWYDQRGWTWSEKSHNWIVLTGEQLPNGMLEHHNAQAWLIHFRTTDEVLGNLN